jgi:hypothetical protein
MPLFIGLYYAILNISTNPPAGFTTSFLWLRSIAEHDPLYILPVATTITQFIQQKMAMPQKVPGQTLDPQQQMMNQMLLIMPLMIGFFAWNFAAGAVIYWITQNIFSIIQQYFITGFGSLRDLPGLTNLPVPPWVKPPDSGESKVIVTQSKLGTAGRGGSAAPTGASDGGPMGRIYNLINRRVEEIGRQRQAAAEGSAESPPPTPPAKPEEPGPPARSARRRNRR